MALPALLAGGSRALGTGSKLARTANVGRKLLGVKPKKNKENQVGENDSSALIVRPSTTMVPTTFRSSGPQNVQQPVDVKVTPTTGKSTLEEDVRYIKDKTIEIDKLLKGSFAQRKKEEAALRKERAAARRKGKEERFEKGNRRGGMGIAEKAKKPFSSIWDGIKNYLTSVLLGFLAVRLAPLLPKLLDFAKLIAPAIEFVLDAAGFLLNGLVTFIDWGYKAYDATLGFIKTLGGENAVKAFEKFSDVFNKVMNLALILAMVGGSGGFDVMDMLKNRLLGKGAQQAAQTGVQTAGQAGGTAAQAGSIGAAATAAIVAGAGLLASALGEGAFQVRKVIVKPIQDFEKAYKEDKNPLTRIGRGIVLNMVRPLYGVFSTVGFLLDVVGAPFRYAIELLRFPFLSEEDKQKQANNLAKFDARIREDLRKALNMVTLGLAFKEKGSFGNIYGNKGAQKEMMSKMAAGGYIDPISTGDTVAQSYQTGGLTGLLGGITLPPMPIVSIPDVGKNMLGKAVGGVKNLFGMFGASSEKEVKDRSEPLIALANKVKDVPLIGGAMFAAVNLALGNKTDTNVYKAIAGQIVNFSNLNAFGKVSSSLGKLNLIKMETGGQLASTTVTLSPDDNIKAVNNISAYLKNQFSDLRLDTFMEEKEQESKDESGQDLSGLGAGAISTGGISGVGVTKGVSVAKKLIADLGISPAQAAGIVGNFLYESAGMNPGEREGAPYGTPEKPPSLGTIGVGYGWAQWTNSAPGDRLDKFLKSYGGDKGKIATDDDNYRYLMTELRGSESLKRRGVITGTYFPKDDPLAASDWFRKNWERAGVPADQKRRRETQQVFDKIKNLSQEQARMDVKKSMETAASIPQDGKGGKVGGKGNFVQGNSGASAGVHFHIGPGRQTEGTILQSKYYADARASAAKVVDYFLKRKSTIYDGRRGVYFKSSNEVAAAQRAHTASGSAGGIDLQVDFEKPHKFPLDTFGLKYRPNGFGASADISGSNSFVAHGRYDERGRVAPQERMKLYQGGGPAPGTFRGLQSTMPYDKARTRVVVQPMVVEKPVPMPMPMGGGTNVVVVGSEVNSMADNLFAG